jgi:hypothetical protein
MVSNAFTIKEKRTDMVEQDVVEREMWGNSCAGSRGKVEMGRGNVG